MSDNVLIATLKYIAIEILWDIVYFPIWWYTKGLTLIAQYCLRSAQFHVTRRLALGVWLKSMFKPMYGDYTKEGRIISVFMRFVVLIWKIIAAVLWMLVLTLVFFGWILLPLVIIYYILYQVFDVPFFFISNQ